MKPMNYKNRLQERYTAWLARRSTIISGLTLMLAISFIAIGCDSIVDQQTETDSGIETSDISGVLSLDTPPVTCIDPILLVYNVVTDSKSVEWGNPNNLLTKTVDIEYYNTLTGFVLRVSSTKTIADVLVDDVSIKDVDGLIEADTWQEFTFDLDPDWQEGVTQTLNLEVAGKGPAVQFDVVYTLIGECDGGGEWPRDTETQIVDVTNTVTGKTWMDRNLGASRAAETSTDIEAYGNFYQWGRAADGHQLINRFAGDGKTTSDTRGVQSDSDQPGHGDFITGFTDWRTSPNNGLWVGVDGINNPCPDGYRLPTDVEWAEEIATWDTEDTDGAIASPLMLPSAGLRDGTSGDIFLTDTNGYYWSGTTATDNENSVYLRISGGDASNPSGFRANGYSVRCLKEDTSD